jgi:hypothetical protein
MISLGNLCSFSEVLSLSQSLRGLSDAPSTSSSQTSAQVMSSANSQRSFLLFYPVTRTTYQASSSSSQLESLTRSSSFLLHIWVSFPLSVCLFLVCLCVYFFARLSPLQEGSPPILFLLSEGNSGQSGPAGKTSLCGTSG